MLYGRLNQIRNTRGYVLLLFVGNVGQLHRSAPPESQPSHLPALFSSIITSTRYPRPIFRWCMWVSRDCKFMWWYNPKFCAICRTGEYRFCSCAFISPLPYRRSFLIYIIRPLGFFSRMFHWIGVCLRRYDIRLVSVYWCWALCQCWGPRERYWWGIFSWLVTVFHCDRVLCSF